MQTPKNRSSVDSSLLGELLSADANPPHRLGQILASVSSEEKQALLDVMEKMYKKNRDKSLRASPSTSYRWLAELLTKHGHEITKEQVRHYMVYIYRKQREAQQ